jgi:hypothetical protein
MLPSLHLLWMVIAIVDASLEDLEENMVHMDNCRGIMGLYRYSGQGKCPVDDCTNLAEKLSSCYQCKCEATSDWLVQQWYCREEHYRPYPISSLEPNIPSSQD